MIPSIPGYCFYKRYHKNNINKLIHIFCIPMITWSICVFLKSFYSCILIILYILYYTILFKNISYSNYYIFFLNIYLFFIWYSAHLFNKHGRKQNYIAIIVFCFSWILQFIGHSIFEKNEPALLDNIYQAFLMAPLFSLLEITENIYDIFSN